MTEVQIEIARKTVPGAKGRGPHLVIADLRIGMARGEFACLVGPSGCGKSTLLNIVAGLDRDFQGRVDFGVGANRPRIGYVFQNPRLLPWRTVRENVDLAMPSDLRDKQLVDHLLAVMGLTGVQHQYPERLSLGMSRRVAIIRAFAIQPTLLLMDEPFVSLDAPTARRVRQLLIKVWEERAHTVLFVTHDLREAIVLADRLLFLSESPMRVIAEIRVDIPRRQRDQEPVIDSFRRTLIDGFPPLRGLL